MVWFNITLDICTYYTQSRDTGSLSHCRAMMSTFSTSSPPSPGPLLSQKLDAGKVLGSISRSVQTQTRPYQSKGWEAAGFTWKYCFASGYVWRRRRIQIKINVCVKRQCDDSIMRHVSRPLRYVKIQKNAPRRQSKLSFDTLWYLLWRAPSSSSLRLVKLRRRGLYKSFFNWREKKYVVFTLQVPLVVGGTLGGPLHWQQYTRLPGPPKL